MEKVKTILVLYKYKWVYSVLTFTMFGNYQSTVQDRFIRYVQIDTQSDPHSTTIPSTEKQKNLSRLLVDELKQIGISDAHLDEWGYVYATIPATIDKDVPVICFCAHVDTSPDSSGCDVKPIVHKNYKGNDIVLPDDTTQVISAREHPYLKQKIGEDIITASGKTLLGADNKAGVAIIMDLANFLIRYPDIKHGTIKILFTPDEEIGRGVDKVNIQKLGANFGYTLDGGERGAFTDETFSADAAVVTFHGVSEHPGYARGKLVNALKVAAAFLDLLPREEFSPETTADREGFVHPVYIEGMAEKASVTLPGKVEKVIEPQSLGEPEKVQISIEDADALYREIRVENSLTDEDGNEVRLKEGADVDVKVEAEDEATSEKKR